MKKNKNKPSKKKSRIFTHLWRFTDSLEATHCQWTLAKGIKSERPLNQKAFDCD